MNKLVTIFLFSCVFAFTNCSSDHTDREGHEVGVHDQLNYAKETISVSEFTNWCKDETHKLAKSKSISDINYNMIFFPPETMALLELKANEYTYDDFKKTVESYKEMSYFKFKIEHINGTGELLKYEVKSSQHYENRIKYMAFDIQNDLYIVQANDTIYPGLCHFERTFEVVPYATVMLAFDNEKLNKEKEFTLVYNDRLFEKGFIKFYYPNKQLLDLPHVVQL